MLSAITVIMINSTDPVSTIHGNAAQSLLWECLEQADGNLLNALLAAEAEGLVFLDSYSILAKFKEEGEITLHLNSYELC